MGFRKYIVVLAMQSVIYVVQKYDIEHPYSVYNMYFNENSLQDKIIKLRFQRNVSVMKL